MILAIVSSIAADLFLWRKLFNCSFSSDDLSRTMKFPCPHCTNDLPYNHLHAAKAFQCPHCKKPFKMPAFEKLPPELQQVYRMEHEKKKQNQETEQKKKEPAVNIADELQQNLIRPEEESLGRIFNLDLHAHENAGNAKFEGVLNNVPESNIATKSYIALKRYPRIFKIYAGIGVLLGVIYIFYNICIVASAEHPMEIFFLVLPNIVYNVSAAAIAVLLFMYIAHLNALLIDVADDLKQFKSKLEK